MVPSELCYAESNMKKHDCYPLIINSSALFDILIKLFLCVYWKKHVIEQIFVS